MPWTNREDPSSSYRYRYDTKSNTKSNSIIQNSHKNSQSTTKHKTSAAVLCFVVATVAGWTLLADTILPFVGAFRLGLACSRQRPRVAASKQNANWFFFFSHFENSVSSSCHRSNKMGLLPKSLTRRCMTSSTSSLSSSFCFMRASGCSTSDSENDNDETAVYSMDSLRRYAEEIVRSNHQQQQQNKFCVYVAGGGSTAVSTLAATPGASSVLLEGRTTYDRHSFLGAVELPDRDTQGKSFSYGGPKAARIAAKAALKQGLTLLSMDDSLWNMPHAIGIGCASALVGNNNNNNNNDDEPKGKGTVVALSADGRALTLSIEMKQPRSRFDEELVLSHLVLKAAEMIRFPQQQNKTRWREQFVTESGDLVSEQWEYEPTLESFAMEWVDDAAAVDAADSSSSTVCHESTDELIQAAARRVVDGGEDAVLLLPLYHHNDEASSPIGVRALAQTVIPNGCLVFPGSFNPPHVGHLALAKASIKTLERLEPYVHPRRYNEKPILFELSLTNVDKPSIDPKIVAQRVQTFLQLASTAAAHDSTDTTFPQQWGIVLTRAPLFEEKLRILRSKVYNRLEETSPRINFVIGTDTLVRILNPKYYRDQLPESMISSLLELKNTGAGFVVGGRLEQGSTSSPRFVSGKKELVGLPEDVASMFAVMEESEFRVDLSSSEIRQQQQESSSSSETNTKQHN